jgi:hypothetical protein
MVFIVVMCGAKRLLGDMELHMVFVWFGVYVPAVLEDG